MRFQWSLNPSQAAYCDISEKLPITTKFHNYIQAGRPCSSSDLHVHITIPTYRYIQYKLCRLSARSQNTEIINIPTITLKILPQSLYAPMHRITIVNRTPWDMTRIYMAWRNHTKWIEILFCPIGFVVVCWDRLALQDPRGAPTDAVLFSAQNWIVSRSWHFQSHKSFLRG